MRQVRWISLLVLISLLALTGLWASGGTTAPRSSAPAKTPEQEAVEHYNRGISLRDKAWDLEKEYASETDEVRREKIERKIEKKYKSAIFEFESATRKNPSMAPAHSSLGYALRKTGQYEDALEAYNRALAINPGYAEAIEYRAEAYLGLNRLDDAKSAYMKLFDGAREHADELLEAMQTWVEKRRADPAGLDGAQIDAFAEWVTERSELAGNTASVSEMRERSW